MASAIEQVAADSGLVAEQAAQAAGAAQAGADVIGRSITGMEQVQAAVSESSLRIEELQALSERIGEITQAISAVAAQTNLLALNAAIEAARAGDHGRGFAVVADEVRRLAENAADSTRGISSLVTAIQNRTTEVVTAMKSVTDKVEDGSRLTSEAGAALDRILRSVEQAVKGIREISTATEQLRSGAREVVDTFEAVAAVGEENLAATEQMTGSTAEPYNTDTSPGQAATHSVQFKGGARCTAPAPLRHRIRRPDPRG